MSHNKDVPNFLIWFLRAEMFFRFGHVIEKLFDEHLKFCHDLMFMIGGGKQKLSHGPIQIF